MKTLSKNCENRDKQQAPAFCFCRLCGGEIYMGERYYAVQGASICADCLPEYSRRYFRAELRTAGEGSCIAP